VPEDERETPEQIAESWRVRGSELLFDADQALEGNNPSGTLRKGDGITDMGDEVRDLRELLTRAHQTRLEMEVARAEIIKKNPGRVKVQRDIGAVVAELTQKHEKRMRNIRKIYAVMQPNKPVNERGTRLNRQTLVRESLDGRSDQEKAISWEHRAYELFLAAERALRGNGSDVSLRIEDTLESTKRLLARAIDNHYDVEKREQPTWTKTGMLEEERLEAHKKLVENEENLKKIYAEMHPWVITAWTRKVIAAASGLMSRIV
jgi:hypothetical protein